MNASDLLLSLSERIVHVIINTIGYEIMLTIYRLQIENALDIDSIKKYEKDVYKIFEAILEKGIEEKEFKTDIPIDLLTKHFVMAMKSLIYQWCVNYPKFNLKKETEIYFKILLSGLKY